MLFIPCSDVDGAEFGSFPKQIIGVVRADRHVYTLNKRILLPSYDFIGLLFELFLVHLFPLFSIWTILIGSQLFILPIALFIDEGLHSP